MPRHSRTPCAALGALVRLTLAATLLVPALAPGRAQAAPSAPLSLAPPRLTAPQTVEITARTRALTLDPRRDYIVRLPSRPLRVRAGISISGGHDVVLVGGEIHLPPATSLAADQRRALYLRSQTGTVHVEGVRISGDVGDAIVIEEPLGARVQLANIHVDRVYAHDAVGFSDTHPDLIQSWAGPRTLLVDGFSGATDYQGFFLDPNQLGLETAPRSWSLRRVDIRPARDSARYMLWLGRRCHARIACGALTAPRIALSDVWVAPGAGRSEPALTLWTDARPWLPGRQAAAANLAPTAGAWRGVRFGRPPGGSFVPAGGAGAGYVSPGYAR